jgi:hypothetical protein
MAAAGTGFSDARHQAVELLSNALPKAEHLFDSSRVLGVVFRVEARMIRQWRRIELISDLLFFAYVSVLGMTVIIGSTIFIDYTIHHQPSFKLSLCAKGSVELVRSHRHLPYQPHQISIGLPVDLAEQSSHFRRGLHFF